MAILDESENFPRVLNQAKKKIYLAGGVLQQSASMAIYPHPYPYVPGRPSRREFGRKFCLKIEFLHFRAEPMACCSQHGACVCSLLSVWRNVRISFQRYRLVLSWKFASELYIPSGENVYLCGVKLGRPIDCLTIVYDHRLIGAAVSVTVW